MRALSRFYTRICELTILCVACYLLWSFAAGLLDCANFGHWPMENDHPSNRLDVDPRSTV